MVTLFLQLCSGVDENAVGTCAELIFAPIDASFSDDAPIIPSGFRIIPLDSGMVSVHIRQVEMMSCCFWHVISVLVDLLKTAAWCLFLLLTFFPFMWCRMRRVQTAHLTLHLLWRLDLLETEHQVIFQAAVGAQNQ